MSPCFLPSLSLLAAFDIAERQVLLHTPGSVDGDLLKSVADARWIASTLGHHGWSISLVDSPLPSSSASRILGKPTSPHACLSGRFMCSCMDRSPSFVAHLLPKLRPLRSCGARRRGDGKPTANLVWVEILESHAINSGPMEDDTSFWSTMFFQTNNKVLSTSFTLDREASASLTSLRNQDLLTYGSDWGRNNGVHLSSLHGDLHRALVTAWSSFQRYDRIALPATTSVEFLCQQTLQPQQETKACPTSPD